MSCFLHFIAAGLHYHMHETHIHVSFYKLVIFLVNINHICSSRYQKGERGTMGMYPPQYYSSNCALLIYT